jgi:CheY-like chemotaxis protein
MSQANNIRVLIVEDEPALNQAYTSILGAEKMVVESCFNGQEALDSATQQLPDIILLDLRMPKMDGLEFLRKFYKLDGAQKTKVIIASNYDKQKEIDEAFALGANRYMLKSWTTPKELVKLVRETLATS